MVYIVGHTVVHQRSSHTISTPHSIYHKQCSYLIYQVVVGVRMYVYGLLHSFLCIDRCRGSLN